MRLLVLITTLFCFSCTNELKPGTTTYHDNGNVARQQFVNADGAIIREIQYHENGQIKFEGGYKDGFKDGEWKSYYEGGTIWSTNNFIGGKREGDCQSYYPNGELRYQGQYENDKPVGKWVFYDENGLKKEVNR